MKSKKFVVFALIFQNVLAAYCVALMVYQISGLITGFSSIPDLQIVAAIYCSNSNTLLPFPSGPKQEEREYKTAGRSLKNNIKSDF